MSSASSCEETIQRYAALRSALAEIQQGFECGARTFPNLHFESITTLNEALSPEAWENFIDANTLDDVWEQWEICSDGESCDRYFGDYEWFERYRRLAESGVLILKEIGWLFGTLPSMPAGCKLDLPSEDDYTVWTRLVDMSAEVATPFLRHVGRIWNEPDDYEGDRDQLIYETWDTPADGGERFRKHPFCVALPHDLFRSSAEAIRIWLQHEGAVTLDGSYDEHVIRLCPPNAIDWKSISSLESPGTGVTEIKPHFEPPTPENIAPRSFAKLTLNGRLIKEFNQPAPAQEQILVSFQTHDWSKRVASPMHNEGMSDHEREKANHDLRQAVQRLNRGAKGLLRFRSDKGFVEWQLGHVQSE
jgi:hypothetical protein